jgi:hypothetical protein
MAGGAGLKGFFVDKLALEIVDARFGVLMESEPLVLREEPGDQAFRVIEVAEIYGSAKAGGDACRKDSVVQAVEAEGAFANGAGE